MKNLVKKILPIRHNNFLTQKIFPREIKNPLISRSFSKTTTKKEFPTIHSVTIEDELRNRLKNIFSQNFSPYSMREEHLLFSYQKLVSELSPNMISLLRSFKNNPKNSPVLLIRNLPIDEYLPSTPSGGKKASNKLSFVSESCLTGFAQILGDVYGYADEKDGDLIHNVCPIKNQEKSQSNEGSDTSLHFHIENAYFDFRPDYLALYCLRSDHEKCAETSFLDVRDIVKKLSDRDIEILRKPVFCAPAPESFEKSYGRVLWSEPRPIIDGPLSSLGLVMHFPKMKGMTEDARNIFAKIEKYVLNSTITSRGSKMEPGDLVIINNQRVMHGRSNFLPRYDGMDRWLQRVYITNNLWNGRTDRQQDYRIVLNEKNTDKKSDLELFKSYIEVDQKKFL